ncbi:MAG: EAL domain-containing protein [Pseudomonadota bacterium]
MNLRASIKAFQTSGKRSLVVEILLAQVGFAIIIAAVAITSLTSGASWVIKNNISGWAERWVADLESLGAGLYSDNKSARYGQIKSYLEKFPEIAFIRYYDPTGIVVFQDVAEPSQAMQPPILTQDLLLELRLRASENEPHYFRTLPESMGVSLSQAVVTTKSDAADLANVASLDEIRTHTEIVGFVELGLNYAHYDAQLAANTATSLRYGLAIFVALTLFGWWMLRRALQPLREIQEPLAKLAEGELELELRPPAHKEIAAIAEGLKNATDRIAQRDAHLKFLAHHDELTGLPNRAALLSELGKTLQGKQRPLGTLLFIDLDQFKYVNDTLGHQAGDAILVQASNRIKEGVGEAGMFARLSGDEFCVVSSQATARQGEQMAQKIMQHLTSMPFVHAGQSFNITCSIGVAALTLSASTDEMMAAADLACQKAKTDGRNRVRIFEPGTGTIQDIKRDVSWSHKLQAALKHNHFRLHFQPIVDINSKQTSHYEVLLRLAEDDELHSPAAFLSAAYRFGLMHQIDKWVIENAFRTLAWYRRQDPELKFTINISASAFGEGDLVKFLNQQLKTYQLDAEAVVIEITEQIAVGSVIDATEQINQLIKVGFQFALDDFGAGYSSFNYLKSLPVQYVKIDGQFVRDLHNNNIDQLMVEAIVKVAKALGKKTVAEYVEHEDTLDKLSDLGVDYAQGYLLGKPQATLQSSKRVYIELDNPIPNEQ